MNPASLRVHFHFIFPSSYTEKSCVCCFKSHLTTNVVYDSIPECRSIITPAVSSPQSCYCSGCTLVSDLYSSTTIGADDDDGQSQNVSLNNHCGSEDMDLF